MMVRYSTFLQALAFTQTSAFSPSLKPMLQRFSSLVVFGDSYTDDGVYQYRPASDGTIAVQVSGA